MSKRRLDSDLLQSSDTQSRPESYQSNQPSLLTFKSCRSVDNFEQLNRIAAGSYGVVCTFGLSSYSLLALATII